MTFVAGEGAVPPFQRKTRLRMVERPGRAFFPAGFHMTLFALKVAAPSLPEIVHALVAIGTTLEIGRME